MIGIFDSGIGGLSIYRGVKRLLPDENVIYLADQANFPYGSKNKEELKKIVFKNAEFLIEKGADIIIVACNTATAYTIASLRKKYKNLFVGVVPVVKTAASVTTNGKVGILATNGTIKSKYQEELIDKYCPAVDTFSADGSILIDSIEDDIFSISNETLKNTISPLRDEFVDTIALGCTHYHFLLPRFKKLIPEITFLGSEGAVARQVKRVLENEKLLKKEKGKDEFYTTGKKEHLNNFLKKVLNIKTEEVYEI
ncbi:glutamate racemase [bacterium (Candidatus Howlettbacteria) CG_4_10_14_0_8_um_filter_40_9]|nr:MAG: glutamate racemase [bacterium (Candidatus Howlettbacteria) CG_4_10_14_0_8_um_filter_40_9]